MGSAFAYNPNNSPSTGLYLINLCTDSVVSYVGLPPNVATGSMANDVTVLNGVAYVSDVIGNQVWSVNINGNIDHGFSLGAVAILLTGTSCAENDPSFCIYQPDGMESISMSGTNSFVLISNLATGLAKYVPATGITAFSDMCIFNVICSCKRL
jgi:hypothetical protein